ncbi:orphan sodium- and chloride-dependent neurotransmitter transporter NTT5 isoform X2 [Notamacropus eugenii]|uniref:orphan sodium- and chloride-dependent neurotransmitter transporter NTT5 isoform X2 n=1 Tax=Notamacropus eugenii TaxID=9315 RepID=UPI003B675EA7
MEAENGTPKATRSLEVVVSEANRSTWSNRTEYIMVQVGFCVGSGTIWRFPSLCQQNGGGTFFVVYVLLLFMMGIPLVFMEMALGHLVCFGVWTKIHPRLWGMGLACSMVCFLVSVYYNIFTAWSMFYLSNSFQYTLPWNQCPLVMNTSIPDPDCAQVTSSIYFWYWKTLEVTGNIEESGGIVPSLFICLLVVWLLIILISTQSLKVQGKASAITSPILWKRAGTQVFYNMGLGFGSIIVLSSISKSKNCAQDAFIVAFINLVSSLLATQVVFSVLGFRATMSTRECSNQSSWKLLQLIKMGKLPIEASPPTELLKKPVKAYTMWLHHLNRDLKKKVLEYVSDCNLENQLLRYIKGPDLVFIAFAEAITKFSGSPFWSVIFFLMFINLGLSTSVGLMQGILIPLLYNFPSLQNYSLAFSVIIGCLSFLCGLLFTQRSGLYFLTLFDEFALSLPLLIVVLFENISVAWIYGAKRFMNEMWDLLGLNFSLMHECLLRYVTPVILLILLIYNLSEMLLKSPSYRAWDKRSFTTSVLPYPTWAVFLGSSLILLSILPILVGLLKGSKKPIILPLPKDSSLQLSLTSSYGLSLTSQDQQAPSSRKTSRFSEAQTEEASGSHKQPSLLSLSKSMGTAVGHVKRGDSYTGGSAQNVPSVPPLPPVARESL